MGRSRSLPNSGAYLAQLIMIACLLGVPSLNAIPLPSLSSIPNQSSHIHSTPYLSKRMEIASLGTLGVRAKNTQAAHESINAEHAATALQKSTIAEGVNKAGATGVDVFPSTHADHPSTLHNLPDEDDPDGKMSTTTVPICLITLELRLLTSLAVTKTGRSYR
ncbi:putative signal peptide protein [Puccinia sorghi]|uniref:Putative signal peptide protein n=1 Tax=Puccinia sorghi TaxID=27349 RepID=A0A0L6USH2_9BASI|nr:putative signal peptide protein [Puccinia sorghi]